MLSLYLLRHAKSSWDTPGRRDFDRPLSARGAGAAPRMGAFIATSGFAPALILCSTARRARETLAALIPILAHDMLVRLAVRLYSGDAQAYFDMLRETAAGAESVMLIGHNPALEDLAHLLTADGDETALMEMNAKFPTAALAIFRFDLASFADLAPQTGHLTAFVTPHDLADKTLTREDRNH